MMPQKSLHDLRPLSIRIKSETRKEPERERESVEAYTVTSLALGSRRAPDGGTSSSYGLLLLVVASLFTKTSASCNPGEYLHSASSQCKDCQAGRWQASSAFTGSSCPVCRASTAVGRYATATGQTSEAKACTGLPCGTGTIVAGKYADRTGQTSEYNACTRSMECSAGRYGNQTGKTSEAEACPNTCGDATARGRYTTLRGETAEAEACTGTPCPAGRFGNRTGQTSESEACKSECGPAIIAGRYATATGQSSEVDACTGAATVECGDATVAGRYATRTGQTAEINACFGDAMHATKCDPGRWSNKTGLSAPTMCDLCAAGRFSSKRGATSECSELCPAGRWSGAKGLSSAAQCSACIGGAAGDCVITEGNLDMDSAGCDLDLPTLTQRKVRVNLDAAYSYSVVGDAPPLAGSPASGGLLTSNESVRFKFGDMLRLECHNGDLPKMVCLFFISELLRIKCTKCIRMEPTNGTIRKPRNFLVTSEMLTPFSTLHSPPPPPPPPPPPLFPTHTQ